MVVLVHGPIFAVAQAIELDRLGRCHEGGHGRQPLETPPQNFAHHGVVVAGFCVGRLDVELAVLAFHEPVRPRHDHGADGVGAHDVAVVVDFDPARHAVKTKPVGQAFEQAGLR